MRILVCTLCVVCLPALAGPSGFVSKGPYGSGAAVIAPAVGGEYVYGEPNPDGRKPSAPLLVQAPIRQLYSLFTSEEQRVLFAYLDKELAQQMKQRAVKRQAPPARKRWEKLNWPRVVMRGDQVCVPTIESSEAPDWQSDLLCHHIEGNQK